MERWLFLRILVFIAGLNLPTHAFFTYPPRPASEQYPAPPVPRGYQPPPDPPLAADYYLNGANIPQNQQWQNQQWNQNRPQQQVPQQQWNQNRPQQQVPQQQLWPQEPAQTSKEPVLINTVIQVFTNDNAPNQLFSEMRTLSSVNGNERTEISRNTTLDTNYGTIVSAPSRTHGNFAHVRAFAATNSSKISKEDLEKELDKELEKAIPFILDELDKSDHKTEAQTTTVTSTSTDHYTQTPHKDVTNEDLEKLINDALSQITDEKLREKERAELEKTRKLTEPVPQTTLPTTFKDTNEPYTETATQQVTTASGKTTSYKTITTNLPTTNEQSTGRIIVFEKSTTPVPETEESAIPEAETDAPDQDVHWVTTAPPSGPQIVTKIVDLEPVQQTTLEPVAQQQDNTGATAENLPITIFQKTTIPPNEDTVKTEAAPELTTIPPNEDTVKTEATQQLVETTELPQKSTQQQTELPPQSTQQHIETTQQLIETTELPPQTTQQEIEQSTSSPILILTQEQQTNAPTTQSGQTGVTAEMLVPHHAVHDESSETHPRTWKPHKSTTLQKIAPTTIEPSDNTFENTPAVSTQSATLSPVETTELTTESEIVEQDLTTQQTESTPQTVDEPQEECPVPNDASDKLRGDVLFLLDGSSSVGEEKFGNAKRLIHDTVKQFRNVGPTGIQVSLIQFNGEPFLEFSFRAHNCITNLLDDISDTSYINGASDISRAIEKAMKFAYTKPRGDRPDAPNVIILITDGQNDENVQVPVELIRKNDTTFLVIANIKVKPNEVASLAQNAELDVFNLTDANTRPLALRLASRIEDVLRGKTGPTFEDTTGIIASTTPVIAGQSDTTEVIEVSTAEPATSGQIGTENTAVTQGISNGPLESSTSADQIGTENTAITQGISKEPLESSTSAGQSDTTEVIGSSTAETATIAAQSDNEGNPAASTAETATIATGSEVPPAQELPASYQDEHVEIRCLSDGVRAIFQVPESFAGVLAAKDYANVSGCSVDIPLVNRDSTTVREISLNIRANNCGLNVIKSESPRGVNNSIVITLFHDRTLVTGQDKSYVVQCFVPSPELEQTLETRLEVEGVTALSKTVSLNAVPPACEYTLRKDTPNGPVLQTALIGQVVYHHWECKGTDEISSAYGLHIHDCWASNGSSHGYEIVDKNGCSADPSLIGEVTYANDKILAHVRSFVFSFVDVQSLLFSCKLSLCLRDKDGCEGISPPVCKQSNFSELLLTRRARHYNAAFDAALTVDVETQQISITDPLRAQKRVYIPTDLKIGILIFAFLIGACLGMCCFFWRRRPQEEPPKRMISSIFNDELPIVVEEQQPSGRRPKVVFTTDSLARKQSMTNEGYLPM